MYVDNKCFSIQVHAMAQLFLLSSSVARNSRISLSSINSRSCDAKSPDQYGDFLQQFGSFKTCDIMFDLKVVLTIWMYSSLSSVFPLKMGTLNAGIFVSVLLTVKLTIWLDLFRFSVDVLLYSANHVVSTRYPIPGDNYSFSCRATV